MTSASGPGRAGGDRTAGRRPRAVPSALRWPAAVPGPDVPASAAARASPRGAEPGYVQRERPRPGSVAGRVRGDQGHPGRSRRSRRCPAAAGRAPGRRTAAGGRAGTGGFGRPLLVQPARPGLPRAQPQAQAPQNTWAGTAVHPGPQPARRARPAQAASAAGSTSRPSASVRPSGSATVSPGSMTTRSGPASVPRIRMNPHGASDRLVHGPAGSRAGSNATDSWVPRTSSGTTIRASGAAWASQAGARSLDARRWR